MKGMNNVQHYLVFSQLIFTYICYGRHITTKSLRTKFTEYLEESIATQTTIKPTTLQTLETQSTSSKKPYVKTTRTTRDCINTKWGYRKCDILPPDSFCRLGNEGNNRTYVSLNCSSNYEKINNDLMKIFHLMQDEYYNTDQKCMTAIKWLTCTTLYPQCNSTRSFETNLPCAKTCRVIEDKICKRTWHAYINLQQTVIGFVVIPECKTFPTSNCSSPTFITDLLQIVPPSKPFNKYLLAGIIVASVLFLTIIILLFVLCCRTKQTRTLQRQLSKLSMQDVKEVHSKPSLFDSKDLQQDFLGTTNPEYESLEKLVDVLAIPIFTKENLVFDENLGEGAFGKVVKCKTRNMPEGYCYEKVAVKYLKQNPSKEMEKTFQKEVEILSNFDHPNVIPLVGICMDGPMCIVLELMKYGDLSEYIRLRSGSFHAVAGSYGNLPDGVEFNPPELSFHNLLLIITQVADGLSYLATKRFVHRDIATRNILVGEDLSVKISDFGLAHDIYGSDYYRVDTQKMLPLRWLSPEALSLGKFTIYSDIWAFGVTMWEIFTYGMQPFYGCNNDEVCQRIRCHKVLERPYCCPQKIYELMKSCWKFEPTQRKNCSIIRDTIKKWLHDEEKFIKEHWQRLLLPPLPDRGPSIKKAKLKYLNIRTEITL